MKIYLRNVWVKIYLRNVWVKIYLRNARVKICFCELRYPESTGDTEPDIDKIKIKAAYLGGVPFQNSIHIINNNNNINDNINNKDNNSNNKIKHSLPRNAPISALYPHTALAKLWKVSISLQCQLFQLLKLFQLEKLSGL